MMLATFSVAISRRFLAISSK